MSALVREIFVPLRLAASGPLFSGAGSIGGFLCTTTGTLEIREGTSGAGAIVVSSFAVTAGNYYPIPFAFAAGAYATLGGGAVGTFALSA